MWERLMCQVQFQAPVTTLLLTGSCPRIRQLGDSWETFGRRDRPWPMVTAYPSLYRSTEAFTCISREVWLLHQWTYLMMHTRMFHRNDIHVRWICISQFTITDVKWKWCILYVARWNVNMWRLGGWAGGRPVVCLAFMTVLCILLTVTTIKC